MSRRRSRRPTQPSSEPAPAPKSPAPEPRREIHAIALTIALLVAALGWASRGNLNVDGVSYLDLAARLMAADWHGFVQGYWSPLYPALLAIPLGLTGAIAERAAVIAHLVNIAIAWFAVWLLWRMALARQNPWFTRFAFIAFLVASSRTPRLDAVTPDLLLLAIAIGLAGELLRRDGWRPARVGFWAGAAFLAKTSVWPWLVVALGGTLILRRGDGALRLKLLRAAAIVVAVMSLWVVPMSFDAGHPTIGDTGSYGACWYLRLCDGRSPDSHHGEHVAYHDDRLPDGKVVRVANLSAGPWTYAPWSDPSAWQRGIISQRTVPIDIESLLLYWGKLFGLAFGLWSALLLATVVGPLVVGTRNGGSLRSLVSSMPGAVIVLGIIGVMQFVAVHAEPRLIAPFLMLAALGFIDWQSRAIPRRYLGIASWTFLAITLAIGVGHLTDQLKVTASTQQRLTRLHSEGEAGGVRQPVAVIGKAFPMVPDLYRANRRVVAQLFEPPITTIIAWPGEDQQRIVNLLRQSGAVAIWLSKGKEGYSVVRTR